MIIEAEAFVELKYQPNNYRNLTWEMEYKRRTKVAHKVSVEIKKAIEGKDIVKVNKIKITRCGPRVVNLQCIQVDYEVLKMVLDTFLPTNTETEYVFEQNSGRGKVYKAVFEIDCEVKSA